MITIELYRYTFRTPEDTYYQSEWTSVKEIRSISSPNDKLVRTEVKTIEVKNV